jgi:glycine/D-amino acid oxidase-like deaminating enzyme
VVVGGGIAGIQAALEIADAGSTSTWSSVGIGRRWRSKVSQSLQMMGVGSHPTSRWRMGGNKWIFMWATLVYQKNAT